MNTQEQEWRENEGDPEVRAEETDYVHAETMAKAAALRFRTFDLQGGGL